MSGPSSSGPTRGSVPAMRMPEPIVDAMVDHARRCMPEEACGLLAFGEDDELRLAYCLTNSEHSSVAFTVDPDDHFRALGDAEARGWRIGGVFHSHPTTPAVPSRTDVAGALDPEWLHVIIGMIATGVPEVRVWRIADGTATEQLLAPDIPIASPPEEGGACR